MSFANLILASAAAGTAPVTTPSGPVPTIPALPVVPVPASLEWLPWLVLVIVWLFVAAAIIGPFLRRMEGSRTP